MLHEPQWLSFTRCACAASTPLAQEPAFGAPAPAASPASDVWGFGRTDAQELPVLDKALAIQQWEQEFLEQVAAGKTPSEAQDLVGAMP